MRRSWIFGLLLIVLSLLNCQNTIFGNMEKNDGITNAYFGFADSTGKRVVVCGDSADFKISEPRLITKVIGPGGSVFSLEPLKYRKQSPQSNGRQNYFNFDYCGGYYSQLIKGKLEKGASCLLVSEDFLRQWRIIKFKFEAADLRERVKCNPAAISVFEKAKRVKVSDSIELAKYGTSQLCLFMFKKPSSQEFIGNMVLMVNNVIVAEDNPGNKVEAFGVGDEPGSLESCRSGLGYGRYCKVLNIFSNGRDTIFFLEDGSEESTWVNLVKVQNKSFQTIKMISWYTSPF